MKAPAVESAGQMFDLGGPVDIGGRGLLSYF
jgi:hypothetical protein